MASEPQSSPSVWPLCSCSRSSSCRRVGSASALNTRFRSSATSPIMQVFPCMSMPADTVGAMEIAAARRRRRRPPVLARARPARAGRRRTCTSCPSACRPRSGSTSTTAQAHYGVAVADAPTRCPVDERLAVLDRLGVRAFPTLPYPHKAGHGGLAQRLVGRVRRGRPAGAAVGDLLSRAGGAVLRRRGAASAAPGSSRCTCRSGGFDPRHPLLDAGLGAAGGDRDAGRHPLRLGSAARASTPGPSRSPGCCERYPRLQLVIAHLGMPEYRDFLDLAERYERVHLDTTMFATDFTERLMPFDRADLPRLAALRDKVLLGSDFPSIPYAYAHQLAGAAPAGSGGGLAARRPVAERRPAVQDRGVTPSFTLTAAVLGTPDPPGWRASTSGCSAGRSRDDDPELGDPAAGGRRHRAVVPAGDRPRAAGLAAGAGHPADAAAPRHPGRRPRRRVGRRRGGRGGAIGGHEDDDEIVRVFRDPAGHPFCLFMRT